jgi:hypothetical protein
MEGMGDPIVRILCIIFIFFLVGILSAIKIREKYNISLEEGEKDDFKNDDPSPLGMNELNKSKKVKTRSVTLKNGNVLHQYFDTVKNKWITKS